MPGTKGGAWPPHGPACPLCVGEAARSSLPPSRLACRHGVSDPAARAHSSHLTVGRNLRPPVVLADCQGPRSSTRHVARRFDAASCAIWMAWRSPPLVRCPLRPGESGSTILRQGASPGKLASTLCRPRPSSSNWDAMRAWWGPHGARSDRVWKLCLGARDSPPTKPRCASEWRDPAGLHALGRDAGLLHRGCT